MLFISFSYSASPEKKLFNELVEISKQQEEKKLNQKAQVFFKKYPKSKYLAEIRLLLAENEKNPKEALYKYKVLVDKYRYFPKGDYAQIQVCKIYDLLGDWKKLKKEALIGSDKFPKSSFYMDFHIFFMRAAINLGEYQVAEKRCRSLLKKTHASEKLPQILLLSAQILKKTTGFSKPYISRLKDLAQGFKKNKIYPSVIFLLAEFYENKKDHNRAYSAYLDLIKEYPNSPEALQSSLKLKSLEKYNPKLINFLPDDQIIAGTDDFDIMPEKEVSSNEKEGSFFSISIGPFETYHQAQKIKKEIKGFGQVRLIKIGKKYIIYVGQDNTMEKAWDSKIRIAEEYGINGRIVRIIDDHRQEYIYGE